MANTLRFKRGLVSTIPTALAGEPLFTTDTFDLYIGNGTTNTRFQKYIASGTTSQLLRGDGSLLTMPIVLTSPSNGQVLKYNGTSWVNDSDAGITGSGASGQVAYFTGATTQSGSNNLFWDSANNRLGIGTNVPKSRIHTLLNGNAANGITGTTLIGQNSSSGNSSYLTLIGAFDANAGIVFTDESEGYRGRIIYSNNNEFMSFWTDLAERMRLHATGNLHLGGTSDNGLRFQVTGDGYFSGSVGVGSTDLALYALRIGKNITGGVNAIGIGISSVIQSSVTSNAFGYYSTLGTAAASFTLSNLRHFHVDQGTFGAGSSVTNQYAFFANNITGATNNYGFYGDIASGTGRWNLYMNGTAANYLGGNTTISLNQNSSTTLTISNTTSGVIANAYARVTASGGSVDFGKFSETSNAYRIIAANDAFISNGSVGDIAILNGNASGSIKMAAGDSAGVHFTIASTGLATFTSSVTSTSFNGSSQNIFSVGGTEGMRLTSSNRNLHIGTFVSDTGEKLQVSGNIRTNSGYVQIRNSSNPSLYLNNETIQWQAFVNSSNNLVFSDAINNTLTLAYSTGAATFSSTAQAAGFITSGGTGYAVINSASNTVTALRPTGGGTNIMSTNSNGLHIAVGTQAAGDLILASNNTERIRLSSNGFFSQLNATNPSASITDSYIQYSADVVAGNAAPHFRTENGAVIKLYQETTAVGNAIFSQGGGNAVLDDSTFAGYTIRQVVQALRNQGILQ